MSCVPLPHAWAGKGGCHAGWELKKNRLYFIMIENRVHRWKCFPSFHVRIRLEFFVRLSGNERFSDLSR
jgi:hypothetical protein